MLLLKEIGNVILNCDFLIDMGLPVFTNACGRRAACRV
jgi:hypothetical protein